MHHVPPIGGEPGDPYIDGNALTGTPGSPVSADVFHQIMSEMINLIEAAGLEPDDEDLTQLEQAVMEMMTGSGAVGLAKGTTIASAATTNVGGADSDYFEVSGTAGITSFGSGANYDHVWAQFQGACAITHHATDLILPGGANYTTEAGDILELIRIEGSKWKCVSISKASPFASNAEAIAGVVTHKKLSPAALHAAHVTSAALNGYVKLPGGIIIQWARSNTVSVTFPIAFPNACLNMVRGDFQSNASGEEYLQTFYNVTTTGFNVDFSNPGGAETFYWRAIGY